jgi:glycosyltransferase involved in cell wall biosynthesis
MKVAVVTPTIGSEYLSQCINSVDKQTYSDLTHYIFMDGKEHWEKINDTISGATKVKTIALEENVGRGWYGHRVYSACSFLVNADVICYLDEDNWFDPNHVGELVRKIEQGNDWVFSLRKIYDKEGNYLCDDNCESLGKWPVYFNDSVFHIDTSSFAITHRTAIGIGHAWYGQWGADRQFFQNLKQNFPKFDCTNAHTLNYRLDGNPNSVNQKFFDDGNSAMEKKYGEMPFPWKLKNTSIKIQIAPGITLVESDVS